jgi:hypothetical protein
VNAYEQKQAARKARLERAAATAGASARAAFDRASAIGERFYGGQPILVGHHSERRARADQARMHAAASRGVEEQKRAADLARRAAGVGTAGISSDDPDAIAKLEAELAKERSAQERDKRLNQILRRHAKAGPDAQVAALVYLAISERLARQLVTPDELGRVGIPDYAIKNRGANIRRIEKRIAELRAKAATPAREPIVGPGYAITEDRDANRVQIRFDARPPAATIAVLKSRGFRWAPSENAWQRQASNGAWHAAQSVAAAFNAGEIAP